MKTCMMKFFVCLCVVGCLAAFRAEAQVARSLYFMDNVPVRMKLNPAMQPMKGYFNMPVIGSIGATIVSNPLTLNDFKDMMDGSTDFLDNDNLYNKLKAKNNVNLDLNMDILSFGFYTGKGFWTVNAGVKVVFGATIPKSLFTVARDADDILKEVNEYLGGSTIPSEADIARLQEKAHFDVQDVILSADAFAEIGLGYSRPVTERLTVGGRVKMLLGVGNLDARINKMSLDLEGADINHPEDLDPRWRVQTDGTMNVSMKGLDLGVDSEGMISEFNMDSPGIGGYGFGLDLGATYNVWNDLTVSAAILDLGFLNWSAEATTIATASGDHTYKPEDGGEVFDLSMFNFQVKDATEKRHSSLRSTLNLGAEYDFFDNKLGVGLLFTNRFQPAKDFSELTLSANYHPKNWFGATMSYSFLQGDAKTFGVGLKLGPIFVATDYMMTGGFDTIKQINGFLGISLGLGKTQKEAYGYEE